MNQQIINSLCEKFNTTAGKLISEISKYCRASSIAGIMISLLCVVITILIGVIILKFMIKKERKGLLIYGDDEIFAVGMSFFLLFIPEFIALSYNLYRFIVFTYAPNGAAINFIIKQISN